MLQANPFSIIWYNNIDYSKLDFSIGHNFYKLIKFREKTYKGILFFNDCIELLRQRAGQNVVE